MSILADIKKSYPGFTLDVQIEAGSERVALLGASGCGKSCTLRCIAGVETPDEGRIVVNGTTFFDSKRGINLTPQQRRCALMFQNYQLFPHLTVRENVEAGMARAASADERAEAARRCLAVFGVSELDERYPLALSGGQQQRVALSRMIAARPGILMFDEPLSALDSYLKNALEQNLLDLFSAADRTVLYVSHDIDEACRLCERIIVMHDGRVEEEGSVAAVVGAPRSLAGLRLTGCKNTSAAEKAGPTRVRALDWGMTFEMGRPVPDDVAHLGIRATHIHRDDSTGAAGAPARQNSFELAVARVSDARFERVVLLDPPRADAPSRLTWKVGTVDAPEGSLPHEGDVLRLHFDASRIHLVSR
ncbi:MAG: ATP-binding cassette domain-containing protein [Coriobacteriaceae bacterium]|nr:ATP-binding cassette domain-containing protein [Coriobacteriaceae bacterium]